MRFDRSTRLAALAVSALVALAAACTVAPVDPGRTAPRAASLGKTTSTTSTTTATPALIASSTVGNVSTADYPVDPLVGGPVAIQGNVVQFPPNSICDPATSSYGLTEWDLPCTPLTTPIVIRGYVVGASRTETAVDTTATPLQ